MEPYKNDGDEIDFTQLLGEGQSYHVYLITYRLIYERRKVANCILEAFAQKGKTCISEHLPCCMKEHQDGSKFRRVMT